MKNQFISVALALSAMPFAFWKLDGPFGKKILSGTEIERLSLDTELVHAGPAGSGNMHKTLFLYNKETGYKICYTTPMFGSWNKQIVNFFLGKNSFEKGYQGGWDSDYIRFKFYLVKGQSNRDINDLEDLKKFNDYIDRSSQNTASKTLSIESQVKDLTNYIKELTKYVQSLNNNVTFTPKTALPSFELFQSAILNPKIIVSSEIEINNEVNTPKIKFQDKTISFQDALEKRIPIDEEQKKLLNQSRILAVYGVFEDEEVRDSIIWGLAEDKEDPTKKFHWIADIKDNFSVLVQND